MSVEKEQVDAAKALAPIIAAMAVSAEKINESFMAQVESMQKLTEVMSQLKLNDVVDGLSEVSKNVTELVDKMTQLNDSQQETFEDMSKMSVEAGKEVVNLTTNVNSAKSATESLNQSPLSKFVSALQETGGVTKLVTTKLTDLAGTMKKKFPTASVTIVGALSGLAQGFRNVIAVGKSFGGFITKTVSGIANIAGAIIAIPFKMFSGLIDIANKSSGGSNELMQAIEDLRKEFGELGRGSPKVIMDMAVNMKGFSATGLGAFQVFGNLHERLQQFLKLAQGMGPMFQAFGNEFKENGGAILAWQKGLGLSDEMMKTIGQNAKTMGKSMSSVLLPIQKQAMDLGRAFDIDSKLIARDMVKAMGDLKHFAGATGKEIGAATVYARKLGLELHDITGVLDAFDTFDSAADNASKLSQAFGVNVDAMKLMEAQDPASALDMLRKSFKDAGQDVSGYNRQQVALLASSTGLSAEQVKLALSSKNQGVSLDAITKKGTAAEKKTLTQADAMKDLASSIERMVKSGEAQEGGFFERFFKGIKGGLQSSGEFRMTIMSIKQALNLTERAGVGLGRALSQLTVVKDILGPIVALFQPKKFGALFGGISIEVEKFAKGASTFQDMMDNIKKHFFNFFDKESPEGKKLIGGFSRMFEYIIKALSKGIAWASTTLAGFMYKIAEFIINPKAALDAAKATGGAAATIIAMLTPLKDALLNAWIILWPAIQKLSITIFKEMGILWGKLVKNDEFQKFVKMALPAVFAMLFGPAVMKGALSFATTTLAKSFGEMLLKAMTGPAVDAAAGAGAKATGNVLMKSLGGLSKFLGPVAIAAALAGVALGADSGIKKYETDLLKTFGKTEAHLAAGAAGILDGITLGLLPDWAMPAIASAIASLGTIVFKSIENILGKSFTQRLKNYLSSVLDVFASIGNLIKAIFSGDEKNIGDAFKGLGESFLKYLGNYYAFLIEAIPTLYIKMFEFGTKLVSVFYSVLSDLFAKGKDIPVIGPIFELLSNYFGLMGKLFGFISEKLGLVGKAIQESGIVNTLTKAFAEMWPIIKNVGIAILAVIGLITAPIWIPVMLAIKAVAVAIGFLKDNFDLLADGFMDALPYIIAFGKGVAVGIAMLSAPLWVPLVAVIKIISASVDFLRNNFDLLSDAFMDLLPYIIGFGKGVAIGMAALTAPLWLPIAAVIALFHLGFDGIWKHIQDFGGYIKEIFKLVAFNISSAFISVYESGMNAFSKLKQTVIQAVDNIWDRMKQVFSEQPLVIMFGFITSAFIKAIQPILDNPIFKTLIALVKKTFGIASDSKVFKGIGDNVAGGFSTGISDMPGDMAKTMADVNKEAEKGAAKTQGEVAKVAITPSVNKGAKEAKNTISPTADMEKSVEDVKKVSSFLQKLVSDPTLLGGIQKAIDNPIMKALTKTEAALKTVDSTFSMLANLIYSIQKFSTSADGKSVSPDSIIASVAGAAIMLGRMLNESSFGTSKPPLVELLDNLTSPAIQAFSKSAPQIASFVTTLDNINKVLEGFVAFSKNATGLVSGFNGPAMTIAPEVIKASMFHVVEMSSMFNSKATADIIKASASTMIYGSNMKSFSETGLANIVQGLTAITSLVQSANTLNEALGKLPDIKLDAKLKTLASGLGVGGKFNYQIKNPGVMININMNVNINAADMERALVLRKDSIIRDRLNFATNEHSYNKPARPDLPDDMNAPVKKVNAPPSD